MATSSIPEARDDSPEFRALIEKSKTFLASRLAGHDPDEPCHILFRELETEAKKNPEQKELLMIAIIAGERAVRMASSKEERVSVILSLADLFLRRSRWDTMARFSDMERALNLVSNTLLRLNSVVWRISALRTLSVILEERYARTGDQNDLLEAHKRLQEASSLAGPEEQKELATTAACILFRIRPDALKFILDILVDNLPKKPVSWSNVTHKKFRFIDARSLAAGQRLRVVEFDALPHQRYVALSYVWRGSYKKDAQLDARTMSIEGAVGADPISIDVLITACECVATLDCQLLWIDGVCIVQSDEEDKAWQIQNMFDIYKNYKQCLVLPGGMSRLVSITEPTTWMHRAWTLQEAVAPLKCTVLFSWTHGTAVLQTHTALIITSISPTAGTADLYDLLTMSMGSRSANLVLHNNPSSPDTKLSINILVGDSEENQAAALLGALSYKNQQGLESAIWRASLTRVSSRPVDAVLSIMGILGVNLNPLAFAPSDRKSATIALMQALLRKGERAEWLGVAPHVDINPEISTLPVFPTITAQGRAIVPSSSSQIGSESMSAWMGDTWWRLVGAPYGSMSNDGTLTLKNVHTLPVRKGKCTKEFGVQPSAIRVIGREEEDVWYTAPEEKGAPYAVKIGCKERYTNAAVAPLRDPEPWLVMVVDEDGGRGRNLGYAAVGEEVVGLAVWEEKDIVIQGTVSEDVEEHGDVYDGRSK